MGGDWGTGDLESCLRNQGELLNSNPPITQGALEPYDPSCLGRVLGLYVAGHWLLLARIQEEYVLEGGKLGGSLPLSPHCVVLDETFASSRPQFSSYLL